MLVRHGHALVRLGEPLGDAEFLSLGRSLGEVMAETDPTALAYSDDGAILNLRADRGATDDPAAQPFGTGWLSLHSEGSGRPAGRQPRYIVLMCREPGPEPSAMTVLTPMDAVAERLGPDRTALLGRTRYDGAEGVPAISRAHGGRTAFSFRDFQGAPLHWRCEDPRAGADAVDAALRALLAGMYAPRPACGVSWERGLLLVVDNTRYFHGRTASPQSDPERPRHLARLRIR